MKRTFTEIRGLILRELCIGSRTINQLAQKTGINWRTARLHLNFLADKGLVMEIVSSNYVRIFGITLNGRKEANLPPATTVSDDKVDVIINRKANMRSVEIR